MADISTMWDAQAAQGDWSVAGAALVTGGDLATAVLISLFTDATAAPDDAVLDRSEDPRGWWGGAIGSKLWLRARAKRTPTLLALVKDDLARALDWLIDDGVARAVGVEAEWRSPGRLAVRITITRGTGDAVSLAYDWAWEAI